MADCYPTVLVVEDEPIIRFYECEIAADAGFLTLEAGDAEQALRELEGPLDIQVLLTDVHMPGSMDGLALASTVQRRWPGIKIVVASGHVRAQRPEVPEEFVIVPKPFSADQLSATLKSLV